MNIIKKIARRSRDLLVNFLQKNFTQYPDAASQLQLKLLYRNMAVSGSALPGLDEVGFKAFSQTDEDGILLYIFAVIGAENRQFVEVCAGDGIECNAANLIINHGWHGLLVDGNQAQVKRGQDFYRTNPHT